MKSLYRLLFSVAFGLLTACGGGSSHSDDASETASAQLRIINAVADAPPVIFDLGEDVGRVSGIDYAKGSGLARIDADSYTGVFSGVLPDGETEFTEPQDLELVEDTRYEVVLLGRYEQMETLVYQVPVDFDKTESRIRIAHLGSALPQIDIHVTEAGQPIESSIVTESLTYKDAMDATTLAAGSYRIRVTEQGEIIYDSGDLTFSAGSDLLIGLLDNAWIVNADAEANQSPIQSPMVMSVFSASGQSIIADRNHEAYVRTFHASPDAPALDVFVDDDTFTSPIVENLGFGEYTSLHSTIAPAQVNHQVTSTGTNSAYIDEIADFRDGGSYTLFLTGVLADIEPAFLADSRRAIASQATYRLVNMVTGDGDFDIYLVDPGAGITDATPVVSDSGYKSYSKYFASAGGEFDIVLTAADSKTPLISPIPVSFMPGENYMIVLHDGAGLTEPTVTIITN